MVLNDDEVHVGRHVHVYVPDGSYIGRVVRVHRVNGTLNGITIDDAEEGETTLSLKQYHYVIDDASQWLRKHPFEDGD